MDLSLSLACSGHESCVIIIIIIIIIIVSHPPELSSSSAVAAAASAQCIDPFDGFTMIGDVYAHTFIDASICVITLILVDHPSSS
jgi:hypothetical protein